MTSEQNKQKAREIVEQYKTRYNDTRDLLWEDLEDVALQAMGWKEKQLIDRLEDWLANNICNAYNFRGDDISATFINDCIKSMKGE